MLAGEAALGSKVGVRSMSHPTAGAHLVGERQTTKKITTATRSQSPLPCPKLACASRGALGAAAAQMCQDRPSTKS